MSTLMAFPARWIPLAHTAVASTAFSGALFIGWYSGLWQELCINGVARWPVEWFPSVSATIGDHPPPRAPFQILIALCATPRFLLLLAQWLAHRYPPATTQSSTAARKRTIATAAVGRAAALPSSGVRTRTAKAADELQNVHEIVPDVYEDGDEVGAGSRGADIEAMVGVARTFCCGGWVYITSRDHHDIHDICMIAYLVLTLPWMYLTTAHALTPTIKRRRMLPFAGFLSTIPPLLYFYYQHNALRVPGMYTYYSMLEWGLVFWDVFFDSVGMYELGHLQLVIVDTTRPSGRALTEGVYEDTKLTGPSTSSFLRPSRSAKVKPTFPHVDWTDQPSSDWPYPTIDFRYRAAAAWLSEIWLSICFWTVFTSLGFQLFYYSVWSLSLSGSELSLLANLPAYTLLSASARHAVLTRSSILYNRALMVGLGMGCYIVPFPIVRLGCVILGTWYGWQSVYGSWLRIKGGIEAFAEGQTFGIALGITMLLKYWNASNNPFWGTADAASGGWNIAGLIISAVALAEYATRPLHLHPAEPESTEYKDKPISPGLPASPNDLIRKRLTALGFGAFVHLLQTFLMDAGTVISWTWTGYPVKGPMLHPYAGVIITAAIVGVLIPPSIATRTAWSAAGCIAAALLVFYPDWTGFIGGTVLTAYLVSLIPPYLQAVSALPPVEWGHGMVCLIVFDVLSVVTAAYAFVPLGWLLRERTDLIIGACMALTVAGLHASQPGARNIKPVAKERSKRRVSSITRWGSYMALIVASLGFVSSWRLSRPRSITPYYPDHRLFSGGIWTVHFGVDEAGRDSQWRMADLVREMEVDVLGLLESDLHRFVYGNRDLTRVISEDLGYYVDLGPGPNKHTWGAALLSKFPIISSSHHLLPSPHGELAPAILAKLDIHGTAVNVLVSHNGQEEDLLDRTLQTTEIARLLQLEPDVPSVFLGYLVTETGDKRPWPYQILMEDGGMWDIEIDDRWRWCEYIAFRGLWRVGFARLEEGTITDTELQVGKFLLPLPGQQVTYESNAEMYWHIGEDDVPEPWRMPAKFRGKGDRGHRYRIWDGPLYYLPPYRSGLQRYGHGWSTAVPALPAA